MPDHSLKSRTEPSGLELASPDRQQRNRMLLAVFVLLVAVVIVLFKDRDSLFSEGDLRPAPNNNSRDLASAATTAASAPNVLEAEPPPPEPKLSEPALAGTPPSIVERTATAAPHQPAHPQPRRTASNAGSPPAPGGTPSNGPAVYTTRAVLPPLRIEVVAGNRHSVVKPGSPSLKVDMLPDSQFDSEPTAHSSAPESAQPDAGPVTNAAERVQISADTSQVLTHDVRPEYPLLARQMKVQGSVVLDAMIGKDGGIQDLQVVQGPNILAEAARQAVRQWRFKPHFQDGEAVETQAHITVNFMISTN